MAPFKTIGLPDGLTERPTCPSCNAMMRLVWIAASRQGEDRHKFECPACKAEVETR
jgi:transposase-like protein